MSEPDEAAVWALLEAMRREAADEVWQARRRWAEMAEEIRAHGPQWVGTTHDDWLDAEERWHALAEFVGPSHPTESGESGVGSG